MDIVYIKWVDTISDSEVGWKNDERTNDFFDKVDNIAEDVGFLWDETDDYLYIISSYILGEISLTRNRTKIPKNCILLRLVLIGKEDEQPAA